MSKIDTIIAHLETGTPHYKLREMGYSQLDINIAEDIIDDMLAEEDLWGEEDYYDY